VYAASRLASRSASASSPASARRRSPCTTAQSGIAPKRGATRNTLTAVLPCVPAQAERTSSRCSASTPAASDSSPRLSGATTVTSSSRAASAGPPPAASSCCQSASGAGGGGGAPASRARVRLDQLVDQAPLPRAPRGGAGRAGVGLGEGVQQVEHLGRADGVRDGLGGGGVGEVATGRGVGQQQVVLDHPDQDVDVGRRQPQPRADRGDHDHAHLGVVAGPSLADVVQQRAEQQQVGAGDAPGERGRAGGGLGQVPVDGEAVVAVALRPAADLGPLRQQAHQQPGLVEVLEHRDGGGAGGQQADQLLAGGGGPRLGRSGHSRASRSRVAGATGRPWWAAARPTRSGSTGSAAGSASRASTTSPSCATTPSASGVRTGPADRRRPSSVRRGAGAIRRQVVSPA
jgi:hypothetical protein